MYALTGHHPTLPVAADVAHRDVRERRPHLRVVPHGAADPARQAVVLVTEGTYPHAHGGVSVWCDQLVRGLPDQPFRVVALTAFGYQRPVWDLPDNVGDLSTVGLWDHLPHVARSRHERLAPSLASALAARLAAPTEEAAWFGRFVDHVRSLDPADVAEQLTFPRLLAALDAMVRSDTAWDAVRQAHAADLVVVADMLDHLLRALRVDPGPAALYHASSNGLAALVCMVASRRHGAPFVLTEHGIYLRERYLELRRLALARPARALLLRFHRLVTATAYARAAVVAPGSRWNVRWEARHGTPADIVTTIYNGIDPAEFPVRDAEPDEPVVAWLGRIDPIKDLETLVTAFAVVRDKRPDARLRIYGRTPPGGEDYRAGLDELVADLDLGDVVSFEGGVAHSADAYLTAQIGVLSSISEGFPYSLIEAMACGLPAVATGVGGVPEAVADTGIVVPPRAPELLAEALIELLDDGARRLHMGAAARDRALTLFTLDGCLDGYRKVYADLAADLFGHQRVALRPSPARRPSLAAPPAALRSPRPGATPELDPAHHEELVAALGGSAALHQAVDADEVAATLESVGVTDQVAETRFAAADVFALAQRIWRTRDRREPPRRVPPPRPQPSGAALRGIAYVVPAVVVAAAMLAGVDGGALVAASVAAWGIGQAGAVLAFTALHRGAAIPVRDLGPLRHGLLAAAAAALLAGGGAALLRSPAAGATVAVLLAYVVASTGLIVADRTAVVLGSLAPVAALSVTVVVWPSVPISWMVGPVAAATVAVLGVVVAVSACRGTRPRRVLQAADLVAALPLAVAGWCCAGLAVLSVSATSHLPGIESGDSRRWLLSALPLWLVVATSEWFILSTRRSLAVELESSRSITGFRAAAVRLVVRDAALGLAAVGVAVALGGLGAAVVADVSLAGALAAAAIVGAVAAALYGATVLSATSRTLPVLAVTAPATLVLGWLALTERNPFAVGDHVAALAVAGLAAAVLGVVAGRVLVDPASQR